MRALEGVRLVDFGMNRVRAIVPTEAGDTHAAPWMAPEQLEGGAAGAASDVFSVGLVAFFALTGASFWRSVSGASLDAASFRNEVTALGRPYNPMEIGVARAVYVTEDEAEKAAAIERRYQGHMRINRLARRPDGETRARYILDDEKEARHESAESALFGSPDIATGVTQALHERLQSLAFGLVSCAIVRHVSLNPVFG